MDPCGSHLFNEEALSLVFRGKFMEHMTRTVQGGKLPFGRTTKFIRPPNEQLLATG